MRAIEQNSQELYERWRAIAGERKNELALVENANSRRWTFGELFSEGETGQPNCFPKDHGAGFVIDLLRAWRAGEASCPLESSQAAPDLPGAPAGCAHLKLTSGSTGTAKCVWFTSAQLAADARNIVSTMGLRPDWPNLAAISLAHSYGFSNLILPLLLHGIPLILAQAPLPEVILSAAKGFGGITLPAVPALWRTWAAAGAIPRNVKLAISAGAPLQLDLEREIFEKHGIKIHNFYGSTECGGIAYDRSNLPRTEAALAGGPMDGVQLSVGEAGTLLVEGEAVGSGYWPEKNEALGNGHFVTTDLVELRAGLVYLRGRTSDMINVAGRKIAPEQIEAVLRRHPAVKECVVFGVPAAEHDRFETIVAAVNAARALPISELNAFLSAEMPAWQIPRQWWFESELTANARGKISRREWRGKYLAEMLNRPE